MSEPRRSTRNRAREDAAPQVTPEVPKETPAKSAKSSLKRKRTNTVVKDVTPSTPAGEIAPLPPKQTLPLRLVDGAPLPTLPEPQPLDLPASEWQNIQQSGVLEASFGRSRDVWVSGANFRTFHKHFIQPKKVSERTEEDKARFQRQKELSRNFPQIGGDGVVAQLVIEPHTFPIRLYGPREVVKNVPKKPQPTYGSWPNHSQHNQHSQPNQYTQYSSGHQPYQHQQPPPPQPRPPPPKPVQKPPPPVPVSNPAPDPVIHMLAARAGTDPQLKAVMKIVANGTASKTQLEFFQTHINELTAILAKQKADAAKSKQVAQSQQPKVVQPSPTPTPLAVPPPSAPKPGLEPTPPSLPKATPSPVPPVNPIPSPVYKAPQPQAPASVTAPKPMPSPAFPPPRPVQPVQQLPAPYTPQPYVHGPPQLHGPPVSHSRPSYTNNYPPQQYHQPQQISAYNPPPRNTYRPLVFEFQEGNNDKFYFPSYSFMEWLPNGSGVKISFLITKMKPKPEPGVEPPSTPAPKVMTASTPKPTPDATPTPAATLSGPPVAGDPIALPNPSIPAMTPIPPATPAAPPSQLPPPTRIEDFDERNDINDIELYQPVTVLLLTDNHDIKQALPRAVRPPDVVEKYMEEVFDKCKRADETYLAFRLPKDGEDIPEKKARSGDGTPVVAMSAPDLPAGMPGTKDVFDKKKTGRARRGLV